MVVANKKENKLKKQHSKGLGTKVDIWENDKREIVEVVNETIEKNQSIRKIGDDVKEIKKLLSEQKKREEIQKNIRNTSFIFKK